LIPEATSVVHGVLMDLTHAELRHLYAGLGLEDYVPEAVLVRGQDAIAVPALCFNLAVPPSPSEANPDYAAKLRALAERLGFPGSYVASIQ
jgi:hypothetical protein